MSFSAEDERFMREALDLARQAGSVGEVPVGALVVRDGIVVGCGFNQFILCHDFTAHVEVMVLRDMGLTLNNYRMPGCTLYVTLEPCAMCSGAIFHARIGRVIFGASDLKTGVAGSVTDLYAIGQLNHHATAMGGLLADECGGMLSSFFAARRARTLIA